MIPEVCPIVETPWPITVGDAIDLFNRNIPDARFVKRMRVGKSKTTLMNFVKVDHIVNVTEEIRREAIQRRQDYVEDDEYCENCNIHMIFESRSASCVCVKCGNSKHHNPIDTSYRDGTSLHTP
jgi:hypothetical protein